jgi:WD40 repeat protein
MTLSPDGSRLASASHDKAVRLWDGTTGAHIVTLEGHSQCVNSVIFSDGSTLASASDDQTRVWDSRTGRHIATLDGHSEAIKSVRFSADGSRLISRCLNGTVLIWDIADITQPLLFCTKTARNYFHLSTRNLLFLLETQTEPTLCGLTRTVLSSDADASLEPSAENAMEKTRSQ